MNLETDRFVCEELRRYLRIPIVKGDQELRKQIAEYLPKEIDSGQFEKVEEKPNSNLSSSIEEPNKAKNMQLKEEESSLPFMINKDILEQLEKNSAILLGTQNEEGESSVICGFMILNSYELNKNLISEIEGAFKSDERRIKGIGVRVEGNTIDKDVIGIVRSFVDSSGIILIYNTQTKKKHLLSLNDSNLNGQTFEITSINLNYIENSLYFDVISEGKGVEEMVDTSENVKTKHVKVRPSEEPSNMTHLIPQGENISQTFNYEFSDGICIAAGKKKFQYWGFILYPSGTDVYRYKTMISIDDMLNEISGTEQKTIIPIQRFGTPEGKIKESFLQCLWKSKIKFFGICNRKYDIAFFMLIDNPEKEEDFMVKDLEKNKSQCLKYIYTYLWNKKEHNELKTEEVK